MSATVRRPSRSRASSVRSPTPHRAPTGSCWTKLTTSASRHDDHAVGLGQARGELGDELGGCHADRAGDALLVGHGVAEELADGCRGAQAPHGTGHVEERLVEREGLHHGGDRGEGGHDRVGDPAVEAVVGREHRRLRAQPPGPRHGHGGGDPEAASLIGGREHHAAVAPADDDGSAHQVGVAEQGRRRVEGVHVDVQDRAAGVVRRAVGGALRQGELPAAHGRPPRGRSRPAASAAAGGSGASRGQRVSRGWRGCAGTHRAARESRSRGACWRPARAGAGPGGRPRSR